MPRREASSAASDPVTRVLALLVLLRATLRVLITELEQARRAIGPLLPSESEQEERCEADTLSLPMRLDRDAGLLERRLANALALVDAALRGVAHGRDEPEHHHELVMARLNAEMAEPGSRAGESLRRLRDALGPAEQPTAHAKLKSERIQGLLAASPEWERSADGQEIRSRFSFADGGNAGDFLRLARDLTYEHELRAVLMQAEDGSVEVTVRGSGKDGLTERDLRGAAALDRLYGRQPQ